jgi:hypothetical protein
MQRSPAVRLRQTAQHLTLLKSAGTPPMYVLRIDCVNDGVKYHPALLIATLFVKADADEQRATVLSLATVD